MKSCLGETFSGLLSKAENEGKTTGLKVVKGAPSVSHLLFADDLMIFSKASRIEIENLMGTLNLFQILTGQQVSLDKSRLVVHLKTPAYILKELAGILKMPIIPAGFTYLGMLLLSGKGKCKWFQPLHAKITMRIGGWINLNVSLAERSCHKHHGKLFNELFSAAKENYKRNQSFTSKVLVGKNFNKFCRWVSWKKICFSKDQGGIGLRSLSNMNMALLAKLAWRILTVPTSVIAKVLNAKYGGKKGWFTNDFIKKDTPNTGKGLREGMQQLKGNAVWKIGSGDHVMY